MEQNEINTKLSPLEIRDTCLSVFGLTFESCVGRKIAYEKQFTVYTIKHFFSETTLQSLADAVNLKNHATIIYSLSVISNQLQIETGKKNQRYTTTWNIILDALAQATTLKELREKLASDKSQQLVLQFVESLT